MLLSDLWDEVRDYERILAPGSESAILGDFWESMHRLVDIPRDDGMYDTVTVPDDEAQWWLRAYRALSDNPGVECIQTEIYDRV